jgi:aminopeptidase-like protein
MSMPTSRSLSELLNPERAGREMYALAEELFPICRSITGDGVRETLNIVRRSIELNIHEVPSGSEVFDWTIPKEWNIRDAYVKDSRGRKVIDFKNNNLHVMNYSVPVDKTVDLAELKQHLYTLPDRPDWIPYRTSYYKEAWGFCVTHKQMLELEEGEYTVHIDSTLKNGFLTYAEHVHQGATTDEVLFTTHVCHPSLANDNLSGIAVLTHLASMLSTCATRYTYRFLWIPGTIGSIAWLAGNHETVAHIKHGVVVSCVGDGGGPIYKRSRREYTEINRIMEHVLKSGYDSAVIEEFSPYGYDERQFCSPGFDLPVGLLQRSKYGQYPQYHTSADSLDYIKPVHLAESLGILAQAIDILEQNIVYRSTNPFCEPQLGKRGLYESMGGGNEKVARQMAMLWVLNLSDGGNSLLDIAERSRLPFADVSRAASSLEDNGLLQRAAEA